ncbi:MAG: 30S ribosomal protein S20 [Candidatus Saccharimonadales bacterium]|nr:30S ribosomal protein S20 [Candidatus Saccharimonadales bacterium]
MPVIKSAMKRARQAEKRRARNVKVKRALRSTVKEFEAAVEKKDKKKTAELLPQVYSAFDTATKKHLIHKNKASRNKARFAAMAKQINSGTPSKKAATKKAASKKS